MRTQHVLKIACLALAVALLRFSAASARNEAPKYTEKFVHNFCKAGYPNCVDGVQPKSGLIMDANGSLYGSTEGSGKYNSGVIFRLTPNADHSKYTETVLYNFCKNGGDCLELPRGDLIMDVDGDLWGTAYTGGLPDHCRGGCGGVFKLTHSGADWTVSAIYKFCQVIVDSKCADGAIPSTGLAYVGQASGALWDKSSPLFGTTEKGGLGAGVVFKLTASGGTWAETVIHAFTSSAGANALTLDAAGNIYGTTNAGGKYGGGLMYMLEHGTWTQTVFKALCSLQDCADGGYPTGRLLLDASGNIFGTTIDGGDNCSQQDGCGGVIFERTAGGTYKTLHDFGSGSNDGRHPYAGLVMDSSGNLFGTTYEGGSYDGLRCFYDCGTAFMLSKNGDGTWSEALLHKFKGGIVDGKNPFFGSLILDRAGNLFGTTLYGGKYGEGTVFELKP
jgi:uncharacterized repeat protein (TIGR03803 family)